MSNIKNVTVIGTGVIGAGWIIRCLAHSKKVVAFDKDLKLKKKLIAEIKRTWPYVKKLFNKKKLNLKNFKYVTSIEEALKEADFIQECATENYAIKTKLMNIIGKYAKPNAIISSKYDSSFAKGETKRGRLYWYKPMAFSSASDTIILYCSDSCIARVTFSPGGAPTAVISIVFIKFICYLCFRKS